MNNISFIVLASFGYGVGTDKTLTTKCMSDLKKSKCLLDKPLKTVESLLEGESGTTRHLVEMRLTPFGLRKLLFDYIYPEEIIHTGGSITLNYGWCDAIGFDATTQENYSNKCLDAADLQAAKLCKKLTGQTYYQWDKEFPYACQCIIAMAGYTNHSAYVTPVVERDGKYELCEETWKFFEEQMRNTCDKWEDEFIDFFDL
jgi:hypothetical protein